MVLMRSKAMALLVSITLTTAVLAGCGAQKSAAPTTPTVTKTRHTHDWIDVYNRSGERVTTISTKKWMNYFSDHMGTDGGNATHFHVPDGSQVQYKYVAHQKRNGAEVTWLVYKNKYVKIQSLVRTKYRLLQPVWKLTDREYAKFGHPQNLD